ncbi:MAG: hypothetical protein U9N46_00015 [Euryarchaeota archaeon]|nr:hypothetical protein [Euryarchaeota archaeon]
MGLRFRGQYHSDYTDPNEDGIGEDPHPIPCGDSIDRYPLMHPWAGSTTQKCDGTLSPADARVALAIAASGAQNPAADVSGDDRVTSLDVLLILEAAAGAIGM